jgi:hypothetical protein
VRQNSQPAHPLLAHKYVPLQEALKYPLVLCHPEACEGGHRQIERLLHTVDIQPVVAVRLWHTGAKRTKPKH